MTEEPRTKRTYVFVDGQNLFHAARVAFGYTYPNYDVKALAERICQQQGWILEKVFFYTGVPTQEGNVQWSSFWREKTAQMGRQGIEVYTRSLRYRNKTITLPDGSQSTTLIGDEKGIDVRIAIDVIRSVRMNLCDVALVFSQDQDFSEVAKEVRAISNQQDRWIKIASAYPFSPVLGCNTRGIDKTDWIKIDQKTYDSCLDTRDYRPEKNDRS